MKLLKRITMIMAFAMIFTLLPAGAEAASHNIGRPSVKTATLNYSTVRISWSGVKGAKGYAVYRSAKAHSHFKKIKTTKKRVFVNRKLRSNSAYYYKVRAFKKVYGRKIYGEYSKTRTGVAGVENVTGFRVMPGGTSEFVLQRWNGKSSQNRYEIWRAQGVSASFKKIKTVKRIDLGSQTCQDGTVAGNTQYSYKIRAVRTVNGKIYYSGFSAVKKATAKNGVGLIRDVSVTSFPTGSGDKVSEIEVTMTSDQYNYSLELTPSKTIHQRTINEELDKGPADILYFNRIGSTGRQLRITQYKIDGGNYMSYAGKIAVKSGSTVTMKLVSDSESFDYWDSGIIVMPCVYDGGTTYGILRLEKKRGLVVDFKKLVDTVSDMAGDFGI